MSHIIRRVATVHVVPGVVFLCYVTLGAHPATRRVEPVQTWYIGNKRARTWVTHLVCVMHELANL